MEEQSWKLLYKKEARVAQLPEVNRIPGGGERGQAQEWSLGYL